MRIAGLVLAVMMMAVPMGGVAQTTAAPLFDAITVKPHKGGDNSSWWRWTSNGWTATNASLKSMIASSYNVKNWLVFGLPAWAESGRWDIQAKILDTDSKPIDKLTPEERRALMASLLRERFGLVVHTETKVQPVFELTVLPEGPKFKQSAPLPPGAEEPKFGRGSIVFNSGTMKATDITLPFFAENIAYQVERSIVDKTGLTGEFDMELKWTPEERGHEDNGAAGDVPPAIFEAIKEQLGLKLTSAKAPVPTVVVDAIEQPDEN